MARRGRGRGGGGGRGGRGGRGGGYDQRGDDRRPSGYDEIEKKNERFETYYKLQGLIPEPEFPEFMEALRKPLPSTFRITGSKEHAVHLRKYLENEYFSALQNVEFEGDRVPPPQCIDWYPDGLAYQLNVPKRALRKQHEFKAMQQLLVLEAEAGNISRQELVSMIPPLFMDIQPHHAVLDMCAAPGSKTVQLVEAIHASQESAHMDFVDEEAPLPPSPTPAGLVVANDADFRRAHMLVHRIQSLNSPNTVIVNHDASNMPNFYTSPRGPHGEFLTSGPNEILKFDRVLADVPCSGDGTFRKNLLLWKDWTPSSAHQLHPVQLKILMRGLQMLRPGGRLVYSTCSLNPIEDEAVLAAAIAASHGVVRLVDVSDKLPQLKRQPGVSSWKVINNSCEEVDAFDTLSHGEKSVLPRTMWPPADAELMNLHYAFRVMPHAQDTGGFFVSVLEKTDYITQGPYREKVPSNRTKETELELNNNNIDDENDKFEAESSELKRKDVPEEAEPEAKRPRIEQSVPEEVHRKKEKNSYALEEPFKFLPASNAELVKIVQRYGLNEAFPRDQFLVRNAMGEPLRGIYFASQLLRDVLVRNENHIKFVHGGVRMFVKQDFSAAIKAQLANSSAAGEDQSCRFRVTDEGLAMLYPYLSRDLVMDAELEDVRVLMQNSYPRFDLFNESAFVQSLRKTPLGCVVLRCDLRQTSERVRIPGTIVIAPLWRSGNSCNLMLGKKQKEALMLRLFSEIYHPVAPASVKASVDEPRDEPQDS